MTFTLYAAEGSRAGKLGVVCGCPVVIESPAVLCKAGFSSASDSTEPRTRPSREVRKGRGEGLRRRIRDPAQARAAQSPATHALVTVFSAFERRTEVDCCRKHCFIQFHFRIVLW